MHIELPYLYFINTDSIFSPSGISNRYFLVPSVFDSCTSTMRIFSNTVVCASFSLWIRSRLLRIFLFISLNVFAIFTFSLHFYLCVHVCLANLSKYESQLLCVYDAEHLPDTLYHISLREYNHLSWINNLILCNSIQFTYFPYYIH